MEDFTEHIDDYLADRLAPAERKRFTAALAGDSGLAEEVELQRRMNEVFADPAEIELRQTLGKLRAEPVGQDTREPARQRRLPWLLVAASVLLLLVAGYWYINRSSGPAYSSWEEALVVAEGTPLEFTLTAEVLGGGPLDSVLVGGSLLAGSLAEDARFVLRVYGPDLTAYPDRPVKTYSFAPGQALPEEVFALGRKLEYAIQLRVPIPEGTRARYFTVVDAGAPNTILAAGELPG